MKIVTGILILMTIMSCNSQNKIKQKKTMKTFDIETFEKNKQNGNEYFFTKEDGTIVKQYGNKDEYWETIGHKDSILEYFYEYFKNGKLKRSVKRYPKAFALEILKEYDPQGNLIKETDLDKPFAYTWEDVKEYLKEHGVEDLKKDVINISRWSDDEETTWTLEFNGKYKDIKGRFVITLDGKTGEELEVKLFKGKKAIGGDGTGSDYEIILKKK